MPAESHERLVIASDLAGALAALAERGTEGAALAGGTWIMRAPIRGETHLPFYVGIGAIPELNTVDITEDEIRIGACVTHERLAAALAGIRQCEGLSIAAGSAANPAVRQMATVGGNLCAADFAASDLAPALLSLDAAVELGGPGGMQRLSIGSFLEHRRTLPAGSLLTAIVIARRPTSTAHIRLPLRKAGDYPAAIVSMAASLGAGDTVDDVRVAVGSVEATARRWTQLEDQLCGRKLDPETAHDFAETASGFFIGRDSVEAPAWYRVQVLPALVRRASRAVLAAAH